MDQTPSSDPIEGIEVCNYFVRHRNALLTRTTFTELYVDYYLHLAEYHLRIQERHDRLFKGALAAFTLHCASRPRNECIAWTLHFQNPMLNVFLVGDSDEGAVVGRIFDDHVREMGGNHFFADVVRGNEPARRSAVAFEGADPFRAAELFYGRSEQRPARYFEIGEDEFALVSSHPDCDAAWFEALDAEAVRRIERTETIAFLERRIYRWHCGCDQNRIMRVLAPVMRADPTDLFGDVDALQVLCPRCSARYTVTREALEAFVGKSSF